MRQPQINDGSDQTISTLICKLTAERSNEYVPRAQVTISSPNMDGQPYPAGHIIHSAQPMGLYVPLIHIESIVGALVTSGQE